MKKQARARVLRADKPRPSTAIAQLANLTMIVGRNELNNLLTLEVRAPDQAIVMLIPGLEVDELIDALRQERLLLSADTI